MIPTAILSMFLMGLGSFILLGAGGYMAYLWYDRAWQYDPLLKDFVFAPSIGWNEPTLLLAAAAFLLLWAMLGGWGYRLVSWLWCRPATKSEGQEPARPTRVERIKRPDGAELHVEFLGPADAPPIVLTHGWGLTQDAWLDLRRHLGSRYRLITWDLPGLGQSRRPDNGDYSMKTLAGHLEAVLSLAGGRPAILIGHSIGGMITLSFCKHYPQDLGLRVSGLVLVHTTYTNPVRTTRHAAFYTAIEKPVLVPLLYLTIALSPLAWLMNWMAYRNGSAHQEAYRGSFTGFQTWAELDWVALRQAKSSPSVLARGMLGMLQYDATDVLETIPVPVLVVAGDRDAVCLPEASRTMHRRIPDTDLLLMTPGKHMAYLEREGQFHSEVGEFIDSCSPRSVRKKPSDTTRPANA
jgi:pimeloyl-ACP methyl ester carboxylesterase